MSIVTAEDVFEFCGTAIDIRDKDATAVTDLITRVERDIQTRLGRKLESEPLSNVYLNDGLNCLISGNRLYLKSFYRDIYAISSITESGSPLVPHTSSSPGDYYLDSSIGVIIRVNKSWSKSEFNILISGDLGMNFGIPPSDLKQAIIEIVASKFGLWTYSYTTDDGVVEAIRSSVGKGTENIINKYMLRDVL